MDPYTIIDNPKEDMPVYVVQRSPGQEPKHTLHCNMLLHIALPLVDHDKVSRPPTRTSSGTRDLPRRKRVTASIPRMATSSSSEDGDYLKMLNLLQIRKALLAMFDEQRGSGELGSNDGNDVDNRENKNDVRGTMVMLDMAVH